MVYYMCVFFMIYISATNAAPTLHLNTSGTCLISNAVQVNISYSVIPEKEDVIENVDIKLYKSSSKVPLANLNRKKILRGNVSIEVNISKPDMMFESRLHVRYYSNSKYSSYDSQYSSLPNSFHALCNFHVPDSQKISIFIPISILCIFVLAAMALTLFCCKSDRAKFCFKQIYKKKGQSWYIKKTNENDHLNIFNSKLENITKSLMKKPQHHINVYVVYIDDHPLHQRIVLEFANYLQADLGFNVYFELFQSEQIFKGRVSWMQNCLEKSHKVIVIWSPGAIKRWNDYNNTETVKYSDMFSPVLKNIKSDLFYNQNAKRKYLFGYFEYCSADCIPKEFQKCSVIHYNLMKQFEELYFRLMDMEMYIPGAMIREPKAAFSQYFDQTLNKHGPLLHQYISEMCSYVKDNSSWYSLPKASCCIDLDVPVFSNCNENSKNKLMCNVLSIVPLKPIVDPNANKSSQIVTRFTQNKSTDCKIETIEAMLPYQNATKDGISMDTFENFVLQPCQTDKSVAQDDVKLYTDAVITVTGQSNHQCTQKEYDLPIVTEDTVSLTFSDFANSRILKESIGEKPILHNDFDSLLHVNSNTNKATPIISNSCQNDCSDKTCAFEQQKFSALPSNNKLCMDKQLPFTLNASQHTAVENECILKVSHPSEPFLENNQVSKPEIHGVHSGIYNLSDNVDQNLTLQHAPIVKDTSATNTLTLINDFCMSKRFDSEFEENDFLKQTNGKVLTLDVARLPTQIQVNHQINHDSTDSGIYSFSENIDQKSSLQSSPTFKDTNAANAAATINDFSMCEKLDPKFENNEVSPQFTPIQENSEINEDLTDSGFFSYSENVVQKPALKLAPVIMDANPMDILASINKHSMNKNFELEQNAVPKTAVSDALILENTPAISVNNQINHSSTDFCMLNSRNIDQKPAIKLAPIIMDANPMDILASINECSMNKKLVPELQQFENILIENASIVKNNQTNHKSENRVTDSENMQQNTRFKLAPIIMDENPMDVLVSINNLKAG